MLKSGFYTSIQNLGRFEYQDYGVPISGVMDSYSAKIANALVGNEQEAAVLEITLSGPVLKFDKTSLIAISGANLSPKLNEKSIPMNTAIAVSKDDVLSFGKPQYGCRSYLAVSGGFEGEYVMQSFSMYQNVTSKSRLENGDDLSFQPILSRLKASPNASVKIDTNHFKSKVLDVFKGPEFDLLPPNQQSQLMSVQFSVAKENSRMAYQLQELFKNNLEPIITSLVLPGTVQLTPSGKLIVLMRDCQTTGGYPRVLQLSEMAINQLAQKFTGDIFRFMLVN